MPDSRFYKRNGPFTLASLAEYGQCDIGRGDPTLILTDVAPLDRAESSHIALCRSGKYAEALATTKASACILPADGGKGPKTFSSFNCKISSPFLCTYC